MNDAGFCDDDTGAFAISLMKLECYVSRTLAFNARPMAAIGRRAQIRHVVPLTSPQLGKNITVKYATKIEARDCSYLASGVQDDFSNATEKTHISAGATTAILA